MLSDYQSHCGHPVESIVSGDEGTGYCGDCSMEAQEPVKARPEPRLSNKVVLVCSEHGRITEHIAISETPRCVTNHREAGCWAQITMRTVKSNGSH